MSNIVNTSDKITYNFSYWPMQIYSLFIIIIIFFFLYIFPRFCKLFGFRLLLFLVVVVDGFISEIFLLFRLIWSDLMDPVLLSISFVLTFTSVRPVSHPFSLGFTIQMVHFTVCKNKYWPPIHKSYSLCSSYHHHHHHQIKNYFNDKHTHIHHTKKY